MESAQTLPLEQWPVSTPPAGSVQNLEDPPNDNKLALGVIITCISLSTVFSLLRVYSRLLCARQVKLEDYMGVLGFVFYLAGTCVMAEITSGAGLFVHLWNLRFKKYEGFVYAYVINSILWCLSFLFFKSAIILEWTHIFIPRSSRNTFFWICYILLSANVCLYVATVIAFNTICTPRHKLWRQWIPGHCIDTSTVDLPINALHLAFDLLLLLLPHGVIWRLSMSKRQKLGISIVFSVVLLLCTCAAGRLASSIEINKTNDKSYAYSQHLFWGLGEGTSIVLVFCAPAIPIIFNGSSRISKGKMSTQRKGPSEHLQRPWPRIAPSTAVDEYHRMHEESAVHLTEFSHRNSGTGSTKRQEEEEHPLQSYLGILKTTQIEITTHAETDLPIESHREEWSDIRAEP